jgi:hypothetical protein
MFLLLGLQLSSRTAQTWNPDYAYDLPRQVRMCVKRVEDKIQFSSVAPEAECPAGSRRYLIVFGKEPRGAMALMPIATAQRFYPPLVLSWPEKEGFNSNPLWHFTCVKTHELNLLESKITMKDYKGEITSRKGEDCLEASARALKYCQEEYQGDELLEKCPLSWGVQ